MWLMWNEIAGRSLTFHDVHSREDILAQMHSPIKMSLYKRDEEFADERITVL